MVLQGESMRAGAIVTHNASLGVLREKIVSRLIREITPSRFKVETGLIHNHATKITSRQIDLLIHVQERLSPLYRYEDFVVVHHSEAAAAIEVKSVINEDSFSSACQVLESIEKCQESRPYDFPFFLYGLEGVSIESFKAYLLSRCCAKDKNDCAPLSVVPAATVIQAEGIIAIRRVERWVDDKNIGIALIQFEKNSGLETGVFVELLAHCLYPNRVGITQPTVHRPQLSWHAIRAIVNSVRSHARSVELIRPNGSCETWT